MIGNLILEAPHIWKLIRHELIGNGGKPDADGNAVGGFVRQTEIKHNAQSGSYWYRFFKPDDPMISGGTAKTYDATLTTITEENILATANVVTVQTGEAVAVFGWICHADLGRRGYLHMKKETVLKSELPARIVYRQQDPDHTYVDLDTVIFAEENAKLDFVIYNGNAFDVTDIVIPIMFRIAPRAALNLEKPFY
jgi:hypothetical protein